MPDENNVAESDGKLDNVEPTHDEPEAKVETEPEAIAPVLEPKQPEAHKPLVMQVFPEPNFPDLDVFPD